MNYEDNEIIFILEQNNYELTQNNIDNLKYNLEKGLMKIFDITSNITEGIQDSYITLSKILETNNCKVTSENIRDLREEIISGKYLLENKRLYRSLENKEQFEKNVVDSRKHSKSVSTLRQFAQQGSEHNPVRKAAGAIANSKFNKTLETSGKDPVKVNQDELKNTMYKDSPEGATAAAYSIGVGHGIGKAIAMERQKHPNDPHVKEKVLKQMKPQRQMAGLLKYNAKQIAAADSWKKQQAEKENKNENTEKSQDK